MKMEFNLSEKIKNIFRNRTNTHVINREDIKEFIQRETILLTLLHKKKITWLEFLDKRDKLAGDKLI